MCAQPTSRIDAGDVLFRSLSSLSEAQVGALEAALPSLAGAWSLEQHESCEGSLSLLLMPADGDDGAAHFTVDQDAAGLNLGVLRSDEFTPYGRYDSMEALISGLRYLAGLETASLLNARR